VNFASACVDFGDAGVADQFAFRDRQLSLPRLRFLILIAMSGNPACREVGEKSAERNRVRSMFYRLLHPTGRQSKRGRAEWPRL
jgi:hypothetical protein